MLYANLLQSNFCKGQELSKERGTVKVLSIIKILNTEPSYFFQKPIFKLSPKIML